MRFTGHEPIAFGGVFDTVARCYTGEPSRHPVVWYVGEQQLDPVLFGTGDVSRFVCVGSAGAGKTAIGARWALRRGLMIPSGSIGIAAPVAPRLKVLWDEFLKTAHPRWLQDVRVADRQIVLVTGTKLQFLALKEQSGATGTPAQGFTFGTGILLDEEQDSGDEALANLYMRGRNPAGRSYVLSTCTLKRDPVWRARKAQYEAAPNTVVHTMRIHESPFVSEEYLADQKRNLSPTAYRMLVLAEEAPPERATYPDFARAQHVRGVPQIGAIDITRRITGADLLIGHDPGTLCDVSVILRAYEVRGVERPVWFASHELTTRPGAPHRHAAQLAHLVRSSFGVEPHQCVMRADPYGNAETSPDVTVYREYQRVGFTIRPAVYNSSSSANAHRPGRLDKEARIQCVCSLLLNAAGQTRLYLEPDDNGQPRAKELCASLEMEERDVTGRAEANRKDRSDRSHWCAALGYALWPYEHITPDDVRQGLGVQ